MQAVVAPAPHESTGAALLREVCPESATFLDAAARPFAHVSTPGDAQRSTGGRLRAVRASRSQPTLLINGCGRSGTHALVGLLRRNSVGALHEGHGRDATVGWPYVGRLEGSWKDYWPMSNQPQGTDIHDPIFKVHRHPLKAIRSIASGLTSSGGCRNPSERRWDARAWNCATRFVPLPVSRAAIDQQLTCKLSPEERTRLALHYWVKWNLLADRWATRTFSVEGVTVGEISHFWCAHCAAARTCACPEAAAALAVTYRNMSTAAHAPNVAHQSGAGERVRARKGHGRRAPLAWEELVRVDANMTRVAMQLARQYGYGSV
jgi:hypothetical protein